MKETTQAKITASVAIAKAMAQKAMSPNPAVALASCERLRCKI
jgi:hypothetical protein